MSVIYKTALVIVLMYLVQACAPTSRNTVQNQSEEKKAENTQKPAEIRGEQFDKRSKEALKVVISDNTQKRFRVIYNQFLRKRPGFGGKITLKFRISPDGSIDTASIVDSDTGYEEFDASILEDLKQWNFGGGNYDGTTVTLPFTFYE